jgi:hypothetical protein
MILRDEGGKFVAHVEASLFKMEHSVAKISAACASAILRLSPDWRLYRSGFADFVATTPICCHKNIAMRHMMSARGCQR